MTPLRPLSEGNRLQRAYHRWAAPHYARMAPGLREQAELIDRFLYSRRGLGFWLGLVGAIAGTVFGLIGAGLPTGLAVFLSLLGWTTLPLGALAAWLQPAQFSAGWIREKLPRIVLLATAGGVLGFAVGHVVRRGHLDPGALLTSLVDSATLLAPVMVFVAVAIVALLWGVAQVRRQMLERELERVGLERERDAAARQAAEAQLKLLQGQIQPHFIFNTLSAVQHWVDSADTRAAPLLRALTAFLRGSTEMLGRDETTLAEEATMVGDYVAIMQARLGSRLRFLMHIAPDAAAQPLPPGVLLTLVENAIEHGIAPTLAGGEVQVRAWRDGPTWRLSVRDDGNGLPSGWSEGVGLANCRQRLAHRFGGRATFSLEPMQPGTEARVVIVDDEAGPSAASGSQR
jgi:signal transduction histidine kinase